MRKGTTRRELIGGAIAGAALPAAEAAEAAEGAIPIIDTHQHLWDFRLFHPPWLKGEPTLDKSTTMADYLKATAGQNVRKTIYMEVDVDPRDQWKEAEWVEGVCAGGKTPMVAAVVSGRPGLPGFEAYAHKIGALPHVRGLRQVLQGPGTPRGTCLDPAYVRDIQLLGRLGLSFDICMRPTELADAVQLVEACPEVRFILDHCGNGAARNSEQAQWKRDIAELGRRSHVVCKISGVVRTVPPGADAAKELEPVVMHCIDSFGWNRVMFGGDWPVCNLGSTFAGWVSCLKTIVAGAGAAEKQKLFHDNAAHFYRVA
jgi:L-fuconolactonase